MSTITLIRDYYTAGYNIFPFPIVKLFIDPTSLICSRRRLKGGLRDVSGMKQGKQ